MKTRDFQSYRNHVFDLYGASKYREALEVTFEAREKFPERNAKTSFWIACLRTRLGEIKAALQTLEKASKEGGFRVPLRKFLSSLECYFQGLSILARTVQVENVITIGLKVASFHGFSTRHCKVGISEAVNLTVVRGVHLIANIPPTAPNRLPHRN